MKLTGLEEDQGYYEFLRQWSDNGYTPLGICSECHGHGPAHRYIHKERGEEVTLCTQCVWRYVEVMAEYVKMEQLL